jgi:hypothetical protein
MMDMMVMAHACDLTAVSTFQWTDSEAKHTFPWLGLPQNHHYYQHDGGFRPSELEKIYTWYSEQFAYLVGALRDVKIGDHSLLDETVLFWGSELQRPPTHDKSNMPFVLAGKGGGMRSGRYVKYNGDSHNGLLLSILRLFGDTRATFGDPAFNAGPLTGIL